MGVFQSVFGRKPKVPSLPKIDFDLEQQRTVEGNQRTLPYAEELGRGVNTFNQEELDRMYEQALPGYGRIKGQIGENLAALTRGEIPEDVQAMVLRNAAVRANQGGFAGSGMARNLTARDLGLTSLQLTGEGQTAAQRWLQTAAAPRFDITSMFLTPQQRIPMVMQERDTQWNAQWLRNQIKAMPDPTARGIHDGLVNLIMGLGNYWGGNYQTSSTDKWGGGASQMPQSNIGRGYYTPNNAYNGEWGQFGQGAQYEDAAYGSGGGMNFGSMAGMAGMAF